MAYLTSPRELLTYLVWRGTTLHAFGWSTFACLVTLSIMGFALSFETKEPFWFLDRSNMVMLVLGSVGFGILIVVSATMGSYLQLRRTLFIFHATPEEVRQVLGLKICLHSEDNPMAYPEMKLLGEMEGIHFDLEYFPMGESSIVMRLYIPLSKKFEMRKRVAEINKKFKGQNVAMTHFGLLKTASFRAVKKSPQDWVMTSYFFLLRTAIEEELIAIRDEQGSTSL